MRTTIGKNSIQVTKRFLVFSLLIPVILYGPPSAINRNGSGKESLPRLLLLSDPFHFIDRFSFWLR